MKTLKDHRLHPSACRRSHATCFFNLSHFGIERGRGTGEICGAAQSSAVTCFLHRRRVLTTNALTSKSAGMSDWKRTATASSQQICDGNLDFSKPDFDFVLHFLMGPAKLLDMSNGDATSESSDDELAAIVAACGRGVTTHEAARQAFTLLYRRHARLLRSFLSSRVAPSELDDVEQTVWQRIWEHLPQQFSGGNFRAWLHQISRNFLIDLSRRRQSTHFPEGFDVEDVNVSTPVMALMEHERFGALEACLKKLPEQWSELVRARLTGDDYEVICERMDLQAPRAQTLFFQAKEALVSCLKERDV